MQYFGVYAALEGASALLRTGITLRLGCLAIPSSLLQAVHLLSCSRDDVRDHLLSL